MSPGLMGQPRTKCAQVGWGTGHLISTPAPSPKNHPYLQRKRHKRKRQLTLSPGVREGLTDDCFGLEERHLGTDIVSCFKNKFNQEGKRLLKRQRASQWNINMVLVPVLLSLLFCSGLVGAVPSCEPCPSECLCVEIGPRQCSVDCSGLDTFPSKTALPPAGNIYQLNVRRCSIHTQDLENLVNIQQLDLSNNHIDVLEKDIFKTLTNMKVLNLMGNNITKLPDDFFAGRSQLQTLILTKNPIGTLQSDIFLQLDVLETLSLDGLQITDLDEDTLKPCINLKYLYLNGSQIKSLSAETFKYNTQLKQLYLSDNDLTALPKEIFQEFTSLEIISLSGNAWHCGCEGEGLWKWLVTLGESLVPDAAQVRCASPSALQGHALLTLEQHHFQCDKNVHRVRRDSCSKYTGEKKNQCLMRSGEEAEVFMSCLYDKYTAESIPLIYQRYTTMALGDTCMETCYRSGYIYSVFYASTYCGCAVETHHVDESCTSCPDIEPDDGSTVCGRSYIQGIKKETFKLHISPLKPYSTHQNANFSITSSLTYEQYRWSFGDGTPEYITSLPSVSHNYKLSGSYILTVVATLQNATEKLQFSVMVEDPIRSSGIRAPSIDSTTNNIVANISIDMGTKVKVSWKLTTLDDGNTFLGLRCAAGWKIFEKKCFGVVSQSRKPFLGAREHCGSFDAALLSIRNKAEMQRIIKSLEIGTSQYLTALVKEGNTWYWNNTGKVSSLNNTNALHLSADHQCAMLSADGLVSTDCHVDNAFICSRGPVECRHGGERMVDNDMCYTAMLDAATWSSAEESCEALAGNLVTIDSKLVYSFLYTNILPLIGPSSPFWIGLSDRAIESHYRWEDQGKSLGDFTLWDSSTSEPHGSDPSAHCVGMVRYKSADVWRVKDCNYTAKYICQYPSSDYVDGVPHSVTGTVFSSDNPVLTATLEQSINLGTLPSTVTLFPGMWFTKAGIVQRWLFTADPSSQQAQQQLHLQVYRPHCPEGQYLVNPGCPDMRFQVAICSKTRPPCLDQSVPNSIPGNQYCPLTNAYQSLWKPCTCASVPHEVCNNILSSRKKRSVDFNRSKEETVQHMRNKRSTAQTFMELYNGQEPTFTLVGTIVVDIPVSYSKEVYLVDGNIDVQENDIVGIQHSGSDIVNCAEANTSTADWGQSLISISSAKYVEIGSAISIAQDAEVREDVVCQVMAVYSHPVIVEAPVSVTHISYTDLGKNRYDVTVVNHVSKSDYISTMLLLHPISGMKLSYPDMTLSDNSVGLVVAKAGVTQEFLWTLKRGTDSNLTWTLTDVIFPFSDGCPPEGSHLNKCLYFNNVPVVYNNHTFTYQGEEKFYTITATAENSVSSKSITIDVVAQIAIVNATLEVPGPLEYAADIPVLFSVLTDKGSHIMYTWGVTGENPILSNESSFVFIAKSPGEYQLTVIIENGLNKILLSSDFILYNLAKPSNLVISGQSVVKIDGTASFDILFSTAKMSATFIEIDFGDGNNTKIDGNYLLDIETQKVTFHHVYDAKGIYNIRVIVVDTFEWNQQSNIDKLIDMGAAILEDFTLHVREELKGGQLTISPIGPVSTEDEVSFKVSLDEPNEGVSYTWFFGPEVEPVETNQSSIKHNFTRFGDFNVSVDVSNGISSFTKVLMVHVQEPISGLTLFYNGPNRLGATTVITAEVQGGSDLVYEFTVDSRSSGPQTANKYSIILQRAQTYLGYVQAYNNISKETASVVITVNAEGSLEILEFSGPDKCVSANKEIMFNVTVIYPFPNNLNYIWSYGDGHQYSGQEQVTSYQYSNSGLYNVTVDVSDGATQRKAFQNICIQEPVGAVSLSTPSHNIPIDSPAAAEAVFSVVVEGGTDLIYTWRIGQRTFDTENIDTYTISFPQPGTFQIELKVHNEVSFATTNITVHIMEIVHNVFIDYKGSETFPGRFLASGMEYTFEVQYESTTNVSIAWHTSMPFSSKNGEEIIVLELNNEGPLWVNVTVSNEVSTIEESYLYEVVNKLDTVEIRATDDYVAVYGEMTYKALLENYNLVTFSWLICQFACIEKNSTENILVHNFTETGNYTISAKASNPVDSKVSDSLQTHVIDFIQGLAFEEADDEDTMYVVRNEVLQLAASVNKGHLISYSWAVYDPRGTQIATSDGSGHIYNYTEVGAYTVVLTASNPIGKSEARLQVIVQQAITGLSIEAINGTSGLVGTQLMFLPTIQTGTAVEYLWMISILNISAIQCPGDLCVINFPNAGIFTITFIAQNEVSEMERDINVTIVNYADKLYITSNTTDNFNFVTYKPVEFRIEPSNYIRKDSIFSWSFDDTSQRSRYGSLIHKVVYTFHGIGNSLVQCNITTESQFITLSLPIHVFHQIQNVVLTASHEVIQVGDVVTFVALVTGGSEFMFEFVIDGATFNWGARRIDYAFTQAGSYRVMFKAWNKVSAKETSKVISVQELIKDLRFEECCDPVLKMGFIHIMPYISSGTSVEYEWTIESRYLIHSEIADVLNYTFTHPGDYNITLLARNDVSEQTVITFFQVQEIIEGVELLVEEEVYVGQVVEMRAITTGGSHLKYKWKVGLFAIVVGETEENIFHHVFQISNSFLYVTVEAYNDVSKAIHRKVISCVKIQCEPPKVKIIGGSHREEYKSRTLHLEAQVTMNCTNYHVKYKWDVYHGNCSMKGSIVTITLLYTLKQPNLILPGGLLSYGQYCTHFSVHYESTPVTISTEVDVDIIPSDLIAIIDGGTNRTFSTDQQITLTSLSYDPDNILVMQQYRWTCESKNLMGGAKESKGCFDEESSKTVIIPAQTLQANTMYTYTLEYSVVGFNDVERLPAYTHQTLMIKGSSVPIASIDCISCRESNAFLISSKPVKLLGKCENCGSEILGSIFYKWSAIKEDGTEFELNGETTTTGNTKKNLALRAGVLYQSCVFSLTITARGFVNEGNAQVELKSNRAPVDGHCTATHTEVVAFTDDRVTVVCEGWYDPDGPSDSPLTYDIWVKRDHSLTTDWYYLYRGPQSSGSFYLSPWDDVEEEVLLIVDIQDRLHAKTTALQKSILVKLEPLSEGETRTQYLLNTGASYFASLVIQNNNKVLIQFTIAFTIQLNQEAEKAESRRRVKRETDESVLRKNARQQILAEISEAGVSSTVDGAHQLAYALALLTSHPPEFPDDTTSFEIILDTLDAIIENTKSIVTSATDGEDLATISLLAIVNNILQVINYNMYQSQMKDLHWMNLITNTTSKAEAIAIMYSLTQISGEDAFIFDTECLSLRGKKALVQNLPVEIAMNVSGVILSLPPEFTVGLYGDEVFQSVIVMPSNPYVWGYTNPITSHVVSVTLFNTSNNIPISGKGVFEVKLPKEIQANDEINSNMEVVYENFTLTPEQPIKAQFNLSEALMTASWHMQLSASVIPNPKDDLSTVEQQLDVYAFLGEGYEPSAANYDQSLHIIFDSLHSENHLKYTFFIQQRNIMPQTLFNVVVVNAAASHHVNVSFGTFTTSCSHYNDQLNHWEESNCHATNQSTSRDVVCKCAHLTNTLFGATSMFKPTDINFKNLAHLNLRENPVIVIVISVIGGLFIILLVWAKYQDLKDLRMVSVMPLCGKDGLYKYEVIVITGRRYGAGTTANVGIKLYGEEGRSPATHLHKIGAFQRNSQDTLMLATDNMLGTLFKVHMWHDNSGRSPSWYLSKVIVRDLQTNQVFYFLAESWFTLDKKYGFIGKDIMAAGVEDLHRFSTVFHAERERRFADSHAWLGVIDRPPKSRFTRVQRVTCCLTLMYTFMCANVMWYGVLRVPSEKDHVLNLVSVGWKDVVVGILACLMVFPVNIIISLLFKKSRSQVTKSDYGMKPGTARTIEIDAMCEISQTGDSYAMYDGQSDVIPDLHRGISAESVTAPIASQLHRTSHARKFHRQDSKEIYETGSSQSSVTRIHREDLRKRIPGPSNRMWSYDGIMDWPEKIPAWQAGHDSHTHSTTLSVKQNGVYKPLQPFRHGNTSDDNGTGKTSSKDRKRNMPKRKLSRKISITESIKEQDEEFWSSADSGFPASSLQIVGHDNIPLKCMKQEGHKRTSSNTTVSTIHSAHSYVDFTQRRRTESNGTDITVDSVFECRNRTQSLTSNSSSEGNHTEPNTTTTNIKTHNGSETDAECEITKETDELTASRFTPRGDAELEAQDLINEIDSINDDMQTKWNSKRDEANNGEKRRSRESKVAVPAAIELNCKTSQNDENQMETKPKPLRTHKPSRVSKRWAQIVIPEYKDDSRTSDIHSDFDTSPPESMASKENHHDIPSSIDSFSTLSRSASQILPQQSDQGYILPHWCIYIGYFFCISLSILSILTCILYGHAFGKDLALKWLVAFFISFLYSAFIVEPLKVLFLAMIVALITRSVEKVTEEHLWHRPALEMNEKIKDVKMRPIAGFALMQAKEEGLKVSRMRLLIRQFVVYVLFLWVILALNYTTHDDNAFRITTTIRNDFQIQNKLNYSNIIRIEDWYDWLENMALEKIFLTSNDNNQFYILGQARIRQIRSTHKNKCFQSNPVFDIGNTLLINGCEDSIEDTASYTARWTKPQTGANLTWNFVPAEITKSGTYYGHAGTYSGGGYTQLLGHSLLYAQELIKDLKHEGWFDDRTRAVFLEFMTYSAPLNHFTEVTFAMELPLSGGLFVSDEVYTFKLHTFEKNTVDIHMILECILGVIFVYLVIHILIDICNQKRRYFKYFWNWYEIFITLATGSSLALYGYKIVIDTRTFNTYLNNRTGYNGFVDSIHSNMMWKGINAWLVFLLTFWVVKQFRFIRLFAVFGRTIRLAASKLLGCAIVLAIILIMYAQLAYMWYGTMIEAFHSFGSSVVYLFVLLRGTFPYFDDMVMVNKAFTHCFVISYLSCILILVSGLIIAVMRKYFRLARMQLYYHTSIETQDYEMIDFMMKYFKKWLGMTKRKPAFRRVKFQGMASISTRSCSSHTWHTNSFLSTGSAVSDMLDLDALESQQYLEDLLDRAMPTWNQMLDKIDQLEILDYQEQELMKQITIEHQIMASRRDTKIKQSKGNKVKKKASYNRGRSFSDTTNDKSKKEYEKCGKSGKKKGSVTPPTKFDAKRPGSGQRNRSKANQSKVQPYDDETSRKNMNNQPKYVW